MSRPPRTYKTRSWPADHKALIARNEILRTSKRVGWTIWRRWSGYYRRRRVETKMHCVKLLGWFLTDRDFDRQIAEFQVRVAILNCHGTARKIDLLEQPTEQTGPGSRRHLSENGNVDQPRQGRQLCSAANIYEATGSTGRIVSPGSF